MIPSKDLFHLIKSLSQTEKAYFKKSSSNLYKGENKYLFLFDAIEKQKQYDERKLKEKFKGHTFVKQLSVTKNYLYNRLLDAMENYHREMSIHAIVRKDINRAELLQTKGLYDQSAKMLRKAKTEAKRFELYPALLEIYRLESSNHLEKYDRNKAEKIYTDITITSSALRDTAVCSHSSMITANLFYDYYKTRDSKCLSEAKKAINNPYFRKASKSKTFSAQQRFREANFFYWYAKGDVEKTHRWAESSVHLFSEYPHQIKDHVKAYMVTLNNVITIACEQKKIKEAKIYLEKLSIVSHLLKVDSQKARFYFLYNTCLLQCLCKDKDMDMLEKKINPIMCEMEIYKNEFNNNEKITIYITSAISYYYLGNIKKCILLLNTLRNEYSLSHNPETQNFFYLFYLIVHHDAGNSEMVPYLVQSYYRFLLKKNFISELEIAIIAFLKKISLIHSQKILREEFIKFRNKIKYIKLHLLDNNIEKFFDLSLWLESKIENKPFAEVVRERAERQSRQ